MTRKEFEGQFSTLTPLEIRKLTVLSGEERAKALSERESHVLQKIVCDISEKVRLVSAIQNNRDEEMQRRSDFVSQYRLKLEALEEIPEAKKVKMNEILAEVETLKVELEVALVVDQSQRERLEYLETQKATAEEVVKKVNQLGEEIREMEQRILNWK